MIITILNADRKFGIGKRNGLLFSLPLDMKYFRETTQGHTVCMGENTLLSFPGSKPLKNRLNIVLSKENEYHYDNVIVVHDFDSFLKDDSLSLRRGLVTLRPDFIKDIKSTFILSLSKIIALIL